jgi:hypothetical protein
MPPSVHFYSIHYPNRPVGGYIVLSRLALVPGLLAYMPGLPLRHCQGVDSMYVVRRPATAFLSPRVRPVSVSSVQGENGIVRDWLVDCLTQTRNRNRQLIAPPLS